MNHILFIIPLLLACGSNKNKGISDFAQYKPPPEYTYVDTLKKSNDHKKRLQFHSSLKDRYSEVMNSLDKSLFDDHSIYKEKLYEGKKILLF